MELRISKTEPSSGSVIVTVEAWDEKTLVDTWDQTLTTPDPDAATQMILDYYAERQARAQAEAEQAPKFEALALALDGATVKIAVEESVEEKR